MQRFPTAINGDLYEYGGVSWKFPKCVKPSDID